MCALQPVEMILSGLFVVDYAVFFIYEDKASYFKFVLQVRHRLRFAFPLPSWLRHRLRFAFPRPSWRRHCLHFAFPLPLWLRPCLFIANKLLRGRPLLAYSRIPYG